MAFTWLEDFKKLEAGRKTKPGRVAMPSTLFGDRYNTGGNGNGNKSSMSVPGQKRFDTGTFTGMGGDGKLQTDMPTNIKNFADHEGEYIMPAATVQELGGPESVDNVIKQLKMKNVENRQGLAGYQTGGAVTPLLSRQKLI